MSAREFVWIVKEASLGTPMASPVAGTDSIYIRLTDGNGFGMVAEPVIEQIPYGGGFAVTAEAVSDHYACKGQLKTKLYPAQAPLLLALLATRINAGQTTPWVTTEPPGDLASVSIYHAVRRPDGTYRRKRFAGVKAAGGTIEVSRQGTVASLALDLLGARSYGNAMDASADPDAAEFPAPAETDYPAGPYTFKQTASLLSIASTRTQYESLSLAIQNKLDGRWFETSYLQVNQFCGRESKLDVELYLKATPDDRTSFEGISPLAASLGFNNGVTGQHLTIAMNAQNTILGLPYDLPLDKAYMQKLTLLNRFDPAAAGDLAIGFA